MESNNNNAPYHPVILTPGEHHMALWWAHLRWTEAKKKNLPDNPVMRDDEDTLEPHLEGVLGEMAFAKHRDVYYVPTVNTFKKPDVAGYQVRLRTKHKWDLIVRPQDDDNDRFVLVTMEWTRPEHFRVYEGEILGRDAKRREWLKNYGNRKPAYFVPKEFLLNRGLRKVDYEPPRRLIR